MSLCALHGFLFAVANAPEEIPVEDWVSVPAAIGVVDPGDLDVDMVALYRDIRALVNKRQAVLPDSLFVREPARDNSLPGSDLHQWSRGFMLGHSWLQKLWQAHLPAELEGNLGTAMMVLGYFSSDKLAEKFLAAKDSGDDRLDAMTTTMLDALPGALAEYINISRSIAEVLTDPTPDKKPQN